MNLSCPTEYPILTENKMECIKYEIKDIIKDLINNEKNEIEKSKEDEIRYYDNILNIIKNGYTSENYDTSNIDKGEDDVIKFEKIIVTFTTSENQRNILKYGNNPIFEQQRIF